MKSEIRLINFIIDSLMFFVIVIIFSFLLRNFIDREHLKVVMIAFYYLYYFIFELLTGQTIGKMITNTKVIDINNGNKPRFMKILIRTLSRLIPIDFLSYIFTPNGIHDILSKTELKHV